MNRGGGGGGGGRATELDFFDSSEVGELELPSLREIDQEILSCYLYLLN